MRSWSLFLSSLFASVVSVLILVIPFCLFLNFYHGDLFISASERTAQRGIEVMMYLTPFLIFIAWGMFMIILSLSHIPKRIIEVRLMAKVMMIFSLVWFSLIVMFQFLDGRLYDFTETLLFTMISLAVFIVPLSVGLISANAVFLKIKKSHNQQIRHHFSMLIYDIAKAKKH